MPTIPLMLDVDASTFSVNAKPGVPSTLTLSPMPKSPWSCRPVVVESVSLACVNATDPTVRNPAYIGVRVPGYGAPDSLSQVDATDDAELAKLLADNAGGLDGWYFMPFSPRSQTVLDLGGLPGITHIAFITPNQWGAIAASVNVKGA